MNKLQLKVIERAINSQQSDFSLNQTWEDIHRDYAIGQLNRGKIKLTATDKQQLHQLVYCQSGVDLNQHSISELNSLHREQALAISHNEKLAGLKVKDNRLAIKAMPNQRLNINQQSYSLPAFAHLDIALENITQVEHDCILVTENYRCFDQLAHLNIKLNSSFASPLVIYRGDRDYRLDTCLQLFEQLKKPVIAMTDLDPSGLMIAQSLPYAVALVAPELSIAESFLINPNTANPNLYTQQLATCQTALDTSEYAPISHFWQLLKRYQAGVVQENWLNNDLELLIHQFQQ